MRSCRSTWTSRAISSPCSRPGARDGRSTSAGTWTSPAGSPARTVTRREPWIRGRSRTSTRGERTGTLLTDDRDRGRDRRAIRSSVGHPHAPDRAAREVRDGGAGRSARRSFAPARDLGVRTSGDRTCAAPAQPELLPRTWCRNSFPGVNDGRSRSGTTMGTSGCRGLRAIRAVAMLPFERAEVREGDAIAFHHRFADRVDRRVDHAAHLGLAQAGLLRDLGDQAALVHGCSLQGRRGCFRTYRTREARVNRAGCAGEVPLIRVSGCRPRSSGRLRRTLGRGVTAARQVLALLVEVRILAPQLRAASVESGASVYRPKPDEQPDQHHRQAHPEERQRLPDFAA